MDRRRTWHARARGLRPRPRVHGDVGVLRDDRRGRGDRDDPPRARARDRLPRHGRHVRPRREREARRQGDPRPARGGHPRDEVRQRPQRRRLARGARRRRVRAAGVRGLAAAARRRLHRPLLPAPRRLPRADRGDGRRDGGARRGGQGALPRPLRGVAGDDPPRARRPPDLGAPDRVLAVDARPGGRPAADVPRARHRLRRLQPARPRLPHRPDLRRRTISRRATSAATTRASRARTSSETSTS